MLKKIKKYYFNIFLIKKYTPYSNTEGNWTTSNLMQKVEELIKWLLQKVEELIKYRLNFNLFLRFKSVFKKK